MRPEEIAEIEQYLDGEMSPEERVLFEQKVNDKDSFPDLGQQLAFMRSMRAAARQTGKAALKEKLKQLEGEVRDKEEDEARVVRYMAANSANEDVAPYYRPAKPAASKHLWPFIAAAASIILILGAGLFFLFKKDKVSVHSEIEPPKEEELQQDSIISSDTLPLSPREIRQIIRVTRIADSQFGFVKTDTAKSLTLFILPLTDDINRESYTLINDTLILYTNRQVGPNAIGIYDFDVEEESGVMMDEGTGQMFSFVKPALKGLVLQYLGKYYLISKRDQPGGLREVSNEQVERIKVYVQP